MDSIERSKLLLSVTNDFFDSWVETGDYDFIYGKFEVMKKGVKLCAAGSTWKANANFSNWLAPKDASIGSFVKLACTRMYDVSFTCNAHINICTKYIVHDGEASTRYIYSFVKKFVRPINEN